MSARAGDLEQACGTPGQTVRAGIVIADRRLRLGNFLGGRAGSSAGCPNRFPHERRQLVDRNGLVEHRVRALAHGVDDDVGRGEGGDEDEGEYETIVAQAPHQACAVHLGQAVVDEREVKPDAAGQIDGGPRVARGHRLVPGVAKRPHQQGGIVGTILDDEDGQARGECGRSCGCHRTG